MISDPGSTVSSLIENAKSNSADAWERLYKLYAPLIRDWRRLEGVRTLDADDLVQETFRSVAIALPRFRRTKPGDSFRAWLRSIVRNKIRDARRRDRLQPRAAEEGEANAVVDPNFSRMGDENESASDSEIERRLHDAIALVRPEFSELTWRIFHLLVVDQVAPADVARQHNVTPNAVYKAKYRVLRRLRKVLSDR